MALNASGQSASLRASKRLWRFQPTPDGFYRLTTMVDGEAMCLDVYPNTYQAHLGRCANYSGQFWRLDKEIVKTQICTQPVFTEERRLLGTVDGTPARTQYVAAAIMYMYQRYCRDIEEELLFNEQAHVGDNCTQYAGTFRGEKVYWGQCHE